MKINKLRFELELKATDFRNSNGFGATEPIQLTSFLLEATLLDPYHLIRLDVEIEPRTKIIMNAVSTYTNYSHALCYLVP
ncbi:MAG: hypothetical protein NTY96_03570 [Bacteroidetes bacterium]|nr:hypothetical protein [Bacteroidota bacterium]